MCKLKWSWMCGKYRFKWLLYSDPSSKITGTLTRQILGTSNITTDADQYLLDILQSFQTTDAFDLSFVCRLFLGEMNVCHYVPMTAVTPNIAWKVLWELLRLLPSNDTPSSSTAVVTTTVIEENGNKKESRDQSQVPASISRRTIALATSIMEQIILNARPLGRKEAKFHVSCCIVLMTELLSKDPNLLMPRFQGDKNKILEWIRGSSGGGDSGTAMFDELYRLRDESTYTPLHDI